MFVRSVFSSYYRLLTGASLALAVFALAGCNEKAAEKAAPGRPVLVATVHYEAETPERSFVGTIRPRIETDMGFRVPGKVAKRLVEVGQTVDVGQPLATLDEVDLKLQAEQAEAEFRAATGVLAQAAAAEQRAKDLRAKGWTTDAQMDQSRAAADEARARLNRAERSVELTKNSLSYATLLADARGVVTATLIEPGQVVASGQTAIRVARFAEKEAVVAIPETLVGPRQGRRRQRHAVVGSRTRNTRRSCARSRPRPIRRRAPISRNSRCPSADDKRLARHDRDADAGRCRPPSASRAAAVGAVQPGRQSLALHRRRCRRADAEAGHREILREQ